jgi:CRISPR-associated exonuclease Cas4
MSEVRITGVYVNYYYICQRKLWLFSRNLTMEDKSDLVTIGKLIDEHSYKREQKHIDIDNTINIDFIGNKGVIHEVKKSDSMEKADLFQVKYYLYYLYKRGVENIEGVINYPKLRQKVNVKLDQNDIKEIETLLEKIKTILALEIPPPIKKTKVCKQCAYFELCYI